MRGELACVVVLAACAACGDNLGLPPDLPADELALRARLGIPLDAKRVIVFGQNAHLDIDWQHTFDDYYSMFTEDAFLQASQIVQAQPRAYYSIAEMAYLQHHLAVHPEELAPLQAAAASGQLRIVGGGMTSPDTLLPETEMLARDYLYGIEFAEDTFGAHPHAAWLPDSFGHGAGAPDLLVAAGFTSVAFSRVDGAPTLTEQILGRRLTPLSDSTAEELLELGSSDFWWRGAGGAKILGHYLSGIGLYCQGDNIDYKEILEVPGGHLGPYRGDDPTFTDASIASYIDQLEPWTKTPYMFVPVGCDFAEPKPELVGYLDGYDSRHYDASGVYAVAAPFEDYATLVGFHGDELPVVDQELSPYFMGFFGSRADLKRGTRDAARPFLTAEVYATLLGAAGAQLTAAAQSQLSLLARTDHHDFITGTSADPVMTSEQLPLLAAAQAAGDSELAQVATAMAAQLPTPASGSIARSIALAASSSAQDAIVELDVATTNGAVPAVHAVAGGQPLAMELIEPPSATQARFRVDASAPAFGWNAIDVVPGAATAPAPAVTLQMLDTGGAPANGAAIAQVVLANAHVTARWTLAGGSFALTSLVIDGEQAIAAPSFVTHDYSDQGGLWRLGQEMPGCTFTPIAPTPASETVQVLEQGALRVHVAFVGADATREVTLDAGADWLDLSLVTGAAPGTTRTAAIALAAPPQAALSTSVPAGWALRSPERIYTPTFWAATDWAQVGQWAVLLRQSTGVRMDTPGNLELIAARDARQEQCDIEGGTGTDTTTHRIEWRIVPASDASTAALAAQVFDRPLELVSVPLAPAAGTLAASGSVIAIGGGGIVSTVKPADRGGGVIVRVQLVTGGVTLALPPTLPHGTITLTDLAEHDGEPIPAHDTIGLDPTGGSLRTLRLTP
ncbi:MAG TPA: hypothetical protein VMJ10_36140 [Kofleriaceae bacterium]|nr:hypothetical protein [Kofleriaceae bacterium]